MSATQYITGHGLPLRADVILVDENDREIGAAQKLEAHQRNLLHRAFSVFIFRQTSHCELLLQQRALHKYHSPGLWTNTCCSHPRPGEKTIAAGERRLHEELGIRISLKHLGTFHYNAHFANGLSENEIDHVLVGTAEEGLVITPNKEEVHAYRWVRLDALEDEIHAYPERFTPWFAQALALAVHTPENAHIKSTPHS